MKLWNRLVGAALLSAGLVLALSACSDDPAACQEGAYNCNGQELQKCVNGAFVAEDTCGMGTMCMASMGHCHEMNEGGGSAGGHSAGGHSAGGHSAGGHSAGGHSAGGASAGGMGGSGGHSAGGSGGN